jgi:hypothetical protein
MAGEKWRTTAPADRGVAVARAHEWKLERGCNRIDQLYDIK